MTGSAAEQIIRIPAVLRGSGTMTVAGCVVETWKDIASSGKAYTRCRIVNDPPSLPDGPYSVEFGGHSVPTTKVEGQWKLIFLAPEIRIDHAA